MASQRGPKRSFDAAIGQDETGTTLAVADVPESAPEVEDVIDLTGSVHTEVTEPLTIRERWRLRHKNRVTRRLPAFPNTLDVSSQNFQPDAGNSRSDLAGYNPNDVGHMATIPIESQSQFIPDPSQYEVAYEPVVAQISPQRDPRTQETIIFAESQLESLPAAAQQSSMIATQIFDSQSQPPVEDGVECPICLEPYRELKSQGLSLMGLNCGHVLCSTCAQHSTDIKKECPVCRTKIKKNGIRKMFL